MDIDGRFNTVRSFVFGRLPPSRTPARIRYDHVTERVAARLPSAEEAELLGLPSKRTPVLALTVTAFEASDDDEGFIREIRSRVAELGTERARLVASLEALNAQRPPTVDPTLIRALPMGQINIAELNHELRFKLFTLFRLEVRYTILCDPPLSIVR